MGQSFDADERCWSPMIGTHSTHTRAHSTHTHTIHSHWAEQLRPRATRDRSFIARKGHLRGHLISELRPCGLKS